MRQHVAQAADGARVQLRDARLVDADLGANLLHRGFLVVVEPDHFLLARRVIFVTGDVAGTDAERFLEESGCRWLSKPFRLSELLRAVRETLA